MHRRDGLDYSFLTKTRAAIASIRPRHHGLIAAAGRVAAVQHNPKPTADTAVGSLLKAVRSAVRQERVNVGSSAAPNEPPIGRLFPQRYFFFSGSSFSAAELMQ